MKTQALLSGVGLAGAAILVGQMTASAVPGGKDDGGVAGGIGPDVIVGSLPSLQKWGTVGGVTAYSIATTSCNIGDEQLDWFANTNQHPVIPQNLYRLKDGRFDQIGMSWLKHGFCALQQSLCGPCTPAGGGCATKLGVGCSDPYSASLNGSQSNLGPRSQVNASTGFFPYPWSAPPAPATIGRRLQVANADLEPAQNPGAQYFGEGMYIHPDDAAAGNDNNNASYRKVNVGSFSSGGYNLSFTGATFQQQPAIMAWKAADADVVITEIDVDGDGRFVMGARAYDNGDGTWRYEYAIYNLNSDRSGGSFSVPVPAGVELTDIGFKDIHHHSGEPYSTVDWAVEVADGALTWSTTETFDQNANANALRWGTLYNFWFTADAGPENADLTLGLFKTGAFPSVAAASIAPASAGCGSCPDFNKDGVVDGADLGSLLAAWGSADGGCLDLNADGIVDGADLGALLAAWGGCQ